MIRAYTGALASYRAPRPGLPAAVLAVWLLAALVMLIPGVSAGTLEVLAKPLFCPIRHLTGILCPGCGMTRAFLALAELDIPRAFALNPFSIPLFAQIVLGALGIGLFRTRRVENAFYALSTLTLLSWWAGTRLAPHVISSIDWL